VISKATEQTENTDRFLRIVKRFTQIDTLSAEVVNEFIERIEVGETLITQPRRFSHWKDEKRQHIRIVYNYIGLLPQTDKSLAAETRGKTTAIM
jgi:hypothetical protein